MTQDFGVLKDLEFEFLNSASRRRHECVVFRKMCEECMEDLDKPSTDYHPIILTKSVNFFPV
jgi:hypothetical protein